MRPKINPDMPLNPYQLLSGSNIIVVIFATLIGFIDKTLAISLLIIVVVQQVTIMLLYLTSDYDGGP